MDGLFVDVTTLPDNGYGAIQIAFLAVVYGYLLFKGSQLIADGAEMLTLVMDAGFVGAVVLPVLGAVPDGAIVLFSGISPATGEQQQRELSVGVGTLAGSTIMLITIPWLACLYLGRVDVLPDGHTLAYRKADKLTLGNSLTKTAVQSLPDVRINAWIMLATALSYLIIQAPGWAGASTSSMHTAALVCMIISALSFFAYCIYQLLSSRAQDFQKLRATEARKRALATHVLDLATLAIIEEQEVGPSDNANSPALKPLLGGELTSKALRKIFDQYDTDHSGEVRMCVQKGQHVRGGGELVGVTAIHLFVGCTTHARSLRWQSLIISPLLFTPICSCHALS